MPGREAGRSHQRSSSAPCRAGGGAAGAAGAPPGSCPEPRGRERRGSAAQSPVRHRGGRRRLGLAGGRSRSRSLGRWEIWKSPRCRRRGEGEGGERKGGVEEVQKGRTKGARSAASAGSEPTRAPGVPHSAISYPPEAPTPSQMFSLPPVLSPILYAREK